jgi:hypothetical protein
MSGMRERPNPTSVRHAHTGYSPSTFSTTRSTAGNPSTIRPLPSISDIAEVHELSGREDAIIIAKSKIVCLDDISLEDDVPDDVSDSAEDREEDLFTTS